MPLKNCQTQSRGKPKRLSFASHVQEEGDTFFCDTAQCKVIFGEPVTVIRISVVSDLEIAHRNAPFLNNLQKVTQTAREGKRRRAELHSMRMPECRSIFHRT